MCVYMCKYVRVSVPARGVRVYFVLSARFRVCGQQDGDSTRGSLQFTCHYRKQAKVNNDPDRLADHLLF